MPSKNPRTDGDIVAKLNNAVGLAVDDDCKLVGTSHSMSLLTWARAVLVFGICGHRREQLQDFREWDGTHLIGRPSKLAVQDKAQIRGRRGLLGVQMRQHLQP